VRPVARSCVRVNSALSPRLGRLLLWTSRGRIAGRRADACFRGAEQEYAVAVALPLRIVPWKSVGALFFDTRSRHRAAASAPQGWPPGRLLVGGDGSTGLVEVAPLIELWPPRREMLARRDHLLRAARSCVVRGGQVCGAARRGGGQALARPPPEGAHRRRRRRLGQPAHPARAEAPPLARPDMRRGSADAPSGTACPGGPPRPGQPRPCRRRSGARRRLSRSAAHQPARVLRVIQANSSQVPGRGVGVGAHVRR
jgi:hypothetical protein